MWILMWKDNRVMLLQIMDFGILARNDGLNSKVLMMDLFLTNMQYFTLQDINW